MTRSMWLKMWFTFLSEKFFFLVFLSCQKRKKFKVRPYFKNKESLFCNINFSLFWWATLLMNHITPMFHDLNFYCTKNNPKNHNKICHFLTGSGETHFLVLAYTLILESIPYRRLWNFLLRPYFSQLWLSKHNKRCREFF